MVFYNIFVSLFTLSEVILLALKRSKKAEVKSRNDSRSLLFLWVTIIICFTIGYTIARTSIGTTVDSLKFDISGVSIIIIGFIIRWVAIIQLADMFTVDVAISSKHILKTDGLYKIVRHPSYLGLMLIITGLALLLNNVLSCIIIIIPFFFVLNYRISVEEKAIIREFENQYTQYKLRVKKIIPLLY